MYGKIAKEGEDNAVWNVCASYAFDKNVKLNLTYLHSDLNDSEIKLPDGVTDVDTDGYVINLAYKGANRNTVGSWGAWATYYDQGVGTGIGDNGNTRLSIGCFQGFYGFFVHFQERHSIVRTEENVFCENSTATQKVLREWCLHKNVI